MAKVKAATSSSKERMRPALTDEAREKQLTSLALDLVEQRLRDGTATSQETTHFLKLATQKSRLEKEILEKQRDLIVAKTEQIHDQKDMKEIYTKALKAMQEYGGHGRQDDDSEEDY